MPRGMQSHDYVERKLTKAKRLELDALKQGVKKEYAKIHKAGDRIIELKDQIFELEFKKQRIVYDTVYTPNERQLDTRIDAWVMPERVRLAA